MSQFPVEDESGLYEAINYLLSGPAGLGQNFQGFSSYTTSYQNGNYRKPFTSPAPVLLEVPDIALSDVVILGPSTVKFVFASTQATAPFQVGQPIGSYDITESGTDESLNGTWSPIGVAECSTTYVIVQVPDSF